MASSHWLTQINCYDNMITAENCPVSHIIRSLWDKARGRRRREKKFPSKRGGTIAEKPPLASVAITQMSQMGALSPPHCVPELSPCTPRGVRELITLFTLQCGDTMQAGGAGQRQSLEIIELCVWDLEPAGSCSSTFTLTAKQRRLTCLWLENIEKCFLFSTFTLKYCFWGKLCCFLPLFSVSCDRK